jgi:hypothetical protein
VSKIDPHYCATVISIVPFPIQEHKPGIYPGDFTIPASKLNEPVVLHLGESVYYVEVDENRSLPVHSSPREMARSLVEDYVTSNLAYNPGDNAGPGVIWKDGMLSASDFKLKFPKELEELIQKQWNWFIKLVKMADDDYEKTRRHQSISDMQRYAAKALNLDKPWIISQPSEQSILQHSDTMRCAACQSFISKVAIICPQCKMIINEEKWKTLKFAQA